MGDIIDILGWKAQKDTNNNNNNKDNDNNSSDYNQIEFNHTISDKINYITNLIYKDHTPNKKYNISNLIISNVEYEQKYDFEYVPIEFISPDELYKSLKLSNNLDEIEVFSSVKYKSFNKMPTRKLIKYNNEEYKKNNFDKIVDLKKIKEGKRLEEVLNTLLNQLYIVNELNFNKKSGNIERYVTNIRSNKKIIIYDTLEHYKMYKEEFTNIKLNDNFKDLIPKWYKFNLTDVEKNIKIKIKKSNKKLKQFLKIRSKNPFEVYNIKNVNFDVLEQTKEILLKLYDLLRY